MRKFANTFSDHIARYAWAMNYCHRKNVLDAASQMGFGAQILSWTANKVGVLDNDEAFLKIAKNISYFGPVEFYNVDLEKEFIPNKWDVIVSFETIEHLEYPEFFLQSASDALTIGGKFIFSVPHMVANIQHKKLYDKEKILKLVGKYFLLEEYFLQDKKPISGKPLYNNLTCHCGVATKQ